MSGPASGVGREGSHLAHDVHLAEAVRIPMRDGSELVADVYRPALGGDPVAGAFPTILERTPYDRTRLDLVHTARYFAARGYNVVLQDVRGRYASDGDFAFLRGPEGEDGYDTMAWIADQAWSDGQVGTTGLSFTGANQQAAAVERPPWLKAQVILDAGYNYWHRTVRHGGAFGAGIFVPYAFWMALTGKEAAADPAVRQVLAQGVADIDRWLERMPLKRGDSPLAAAPSYEDWYFELAESHAYGDDWGTAQWNLPPHVERYPDVPVCFVTSWYGHHAWANFAKFNALRAQGNDAVQVVAGTWLHTFEYTAEPWSGEVHFGRSAAFALDDFRLRWFDRWLKDLRTGVDDEAPVRVFVMGGGPGVLDADGRLRHGGRWREGGSWPLEGTQERALFLTPDGGLDDVRPPAGAPASRLPFDPAAPVPTIGGSLQEPDAGNGTTVHGGAFDQRARAELASCRGDTLPLSTRQDVLAFRSEPLRDPVTVVGAIKVRLWLSTTAPDVDIAVKLVDEYPASRDLPDGFAMNLTDGILRLSYREGRVSPEEARPGQVYEVELELPPTANRFVAGHRIRVDVASSSFPQFDLNPGARAALAEQGGGVVLSSIHHGADTPSQVVLPVAPAWT